MKWARQCKQINMMHCSGQEIKVMLIWIEVCLSGASYGGYAAMHAATKMPGMFKCIVSLCWRLFDLG